MGLGRRRQRAAGRALGTAVLHRHRRATCRCCSGSTQVDVTAQAAQRPRLGADPGTAVRAADGYQRPADRAHRHSRPDGSLIPASGVNAPIGDQAQRVRQPGQSQQGQPHRPGPRHGQSTSRSSDRRSLPARHGPTTPGTAGGAVMTTKCCGVLPSTANSEAGFIFQCKSSPRCAHPHRHDHCYGGLPASPPPTLATPVPAPAPRKQATPGSVDHLTRPRLFFWPDHLPPRWESRWRRHGRGDVTVSEVCSARPDRDEDVEQTSGTTPSADLRRCTVRRQDHPTS